MSFDPLKFAVQVEDKVSGQLDAIKQKLATLTDVNIKVRVENMGELTQQVKAALGKFDGFNLQLPDFGKIISGVSDVKQQMKDTSKEIEAVTKAENALVNAKRERAEAEKSLTNAIAAQNGAAKAQKVIDFTSLSDEVKSRILEIKKMLASPQGRLSDTVINDLKRRFEEENGYLKELMGIPKDVIAKYRSEYRTFATQLVEARRKELDALDKGASDYAAKMNGIKAKYRLAMEGFVEQNVPLSSPSSIPYSALGAINKSIEAAKAQYERAVSERASAEKELASLQSGGTASTNDRVAAEKAVTDATNAHTEAVKKLAEAEKQAADVNSKKTKSYNDNGTVVTSLGDALKLQAKYSEWLASSENKAAEAKKRYNEEQAKMDSFSEKDKINATIAKYEILSNAFDKVRNKLDFSSDEAKLLNFVNAHLDILKKARSGMSEFVIPPGFTEEMRKIWREISFIPNANQVQIYERMGLNNLSLGDSSHNPLEGFLKLDTQAMIGYGQALDSIIQKYKEFGLTKKDVDRLLSIGHGYNAQQIETSNAFGSLKFHKYDVGYDKNKLADIESDVKLLTQQEQANRNVAAAEEAVKKSSADLAAAKENLARVESAEAKTAQDVEAAKQRVAKASEAEKKATDELAKAKEALAKANAESTVGGKQWGDVESMKSLITQLKYVKQLTDNLKDENIAHNTGKMTAYYKQISQLGTVMNEAIADTPKVGADSLKDYLNQVKVAWEALLQSMANKEKIGSMATSLKEEFSIVQNLYSTLSKVGTNENFLESVQTQMNQITTTITASIRDLVQQINAMKETISDDNFTAYKTRIENTATAMDKLTEAFVKFQGVVGKDEGMKNFMTGLGEVISKIRYNLSSLGEGVGNMSGDQLLKNYRRNLDKVEEGLYRLQEARGKIIEAISIGKSSGMDVTGMENYLKFLQNYENRLLKLKNDEAALAANDLGGVFGRTYKNLLSNTSDFVKQANDYQTAATKVMNASIDMESAMTRLTGVIQSGNGRLDVKPLRDMFDELNTLYKKINAQPNATLAAQMLGSDFAQKIGEANRLIAVQSDAERNLRRYTAMMEDIVKMEGRIDMAKAISVALNLPTDQLDAAKKRIGDMFDEINRIVTDKTRLGDTQLFGAKQFEFKRMTADTKELTSAQEKLNRETQKAIDKDKADADKKAAAAAKEAAVETNKWAESQRQAAIQADSLNRKIEKWNQIASRGEKLGVDVSGLKDAISQMQAYLAGLRFLEKGGRFSMTTSEYMSRPEVIINERNTQDAANTVKNQSDELDRNANSKKKATTASNELTLQEQRLAAEMEKVAQSAKWQSQILSDLKSMAMQYLSVYGAQQFINNIIEIGGQLENQRMSIASILGDAAQANTLFEQIQSLAVKSPFGVVELDQYTKQLSAFGFQYNELYDMTKRLADISAGAGTDVGRLALALGHVRAEGALTGYTLRQFAMNNIPMLQKLSDMLSAREGRLVSTQDIRKRVSNKQIGYEDVITVIKGLTNEGGMFYNMQEAISQSTKSKWKNLKDAMDIMYGKMAESDFVGGGLKDLATVLTDLTKKWERIGAILVATGSAWGVAKLAVMVYNSALGANATQTLKAMKAAQQQDAVTMRIAKTYRTLTTAELANTTAKKSAIITMTQMAISNKKLSAEELSRAVALGKLTKYQAFCAIVQSNLTMTQKRYYAEMIKGTRVLSTMQAGVLRLKIAWEGLKASFATFFMNPMVWITAAITALTYLWSKHNEQLERAKELQDSVNTVGREGVKNVKDFVNSNKAHIIGTVEDKDDKGKKIKYDTELTDNYEKYNNTRLYLPVFASLDQASVKSVMDNAEQFIKEYSATPNAMLNDAFAAHGGKVNNLRAQYDSLEKSLNILHKAYAILNKDFREVMDFSMEETGGWLNDDLIENINDYSKAYSEYKNNIAKFANDHEDATNKALRAALGVKSFGDAVRAANEELKKSGSPALSNAQMLQMLLDNTKKYAEAEKVFRTNVGFSGRWDWGNLTKDKANERNRWQDMENDLDTAISSMKTKLKALGWDFKKLTEAQKQALAIALAEMVGKATDSTDEVRDRIVALAKEKVGIQIDVEQAEAVAKLNEVKKQLEALCNKTWMIEVGITGDIATDLPNVDKNYKKAIEDIARYGEAMKKKGFVSNPGEMGPQMIDNNTAYQIPLRWDENAKPNSNTSPYDPVDANLIDNYNKAVKAKEDALKYYKLYGITPPEDKKSGKNGNNGSYKDEFAKRWDERIRIMKEAYDWYEKWRKEYGKDTAFDKVNSRYQDIFKEWRTDKVLPMDFDVKQVADYAKYVRQIKDDALKRYQTQKNDKSKNNGQEALRVFRQAVSLLTDFDWDEIQRRTEEYASTVKRAIDDMSRRWENYKNVLEATGNAGLAAQLAGLSSGDVNDVNMANNLRRYILTEMASNVDFGRVFGMSEKDIQNYVAEELIGTPIQKEGESDSQYRDRLETYKEKVRGIVDALKEWQTAQRNVLTDAASTYAKIIGSAQDFSTLIRKNNKEYDDGLKSINTLKSDKKISQEQYNKALAMLTAKRDYANGQLSGTYFNLMNNSTAMTKTQFDNAMASQLKNLNTLFRNGGISVENYNKELEKLRKLQTEFDSSGIFGTTSALSSLVSGGIPGLKAYYEGKRSKREIELTEKGYTKDDFAKDEEWAKSNKWVSELDKLADAASDTAAVLGIVTGALDGFQKAAQSLSEMFDSFGNETMANLFSDISDGIGAVSGIFAPLNNIAQNAMSGNVGGLVSSVISAPFEMIASPITAFNKLHDKGIERKIESLKEEVVKIENNTSLILQARQRTLGYDSGNLNRWYASIYSNKALQGDAASKDMYEYYMRGGSGSGYTQQLENLKKERENYIEQLNKQEQKKKKSNADIEETKKKIAELDDQIYNFSQDLANELWGIDIKGWAQEISDALATAFENGKNMAEAYADAVRGILQRLDSQMMQVALLEPMFQRLQDKLFGQKNSDGTYSGGVFDMNDMEGSAQRATDVVADFFGNGGEGQKTIYAAQQWLNAFEKGLNDAGLSLYNSDTDTLSNAMQGTTEETSNLLAAYVNALRQDVSIIRIMNEQFIGEYWNSYVQQITGIQGSLVNIDRNVALIYALMSENGALYNAISSINTRLEHFSTGIETMAIK